MHYKRVENIPWQIVGECAVIIDPTHNKIHELDAVGTFIWQQLDGEIQTHSVSGLVANHFLVDPAVALCDVNEFCESLAVIGLLESQKPV